MGSIPLPALHVQPPADPTEGLQRAIQLKSLLNQQALMPGQLQQQQQQIQATGLENQQRQQALNDQKAMTAAMQEWDGKSIDDLSGLVVKHGASATAVMGLKSSILKQKQDLANLDKDQLANEAARSDQLLGHLDAIKGETDPAKRAQVASSQANQILSSGLVKDPGMVQMVQAIASGQHVPDDNQLDVMEKGLRSHSALVADAEKQATAGEKQAQTQKLQAELAFYQKKGLAPGVPLDVQEATDWLAKNPGKGPADFMAYKAKLVPQFNFNLQNAGATGAGGKPSAIAQAIADGSMKWNDAVSQRTPMTVKQQMLAEVKSINPNFNSGDFTVEQKVKEAFTSGAYSQQLNSINRAREHMGIFLDLAKDLDNSDVKAFNRLSNVFSVEFGSDKVGNLNIAKQAFASEVGKAFAGASVGVTDRQELDHQISAASSFQQLAGAAKTADKLLAGAQKALKQTYESGTKATPNFGGEQNQGGGAAKTLSMAQIQQAAKDHGVSVDEAKRQAQAAGYQVK